MRPDGTMQSFEAEAPPLGISADTEFREVRFGLDGGCLYLYSDGVIEGRIETGAELGLKGLLTQMLTLRNKSPQQRLEGIVHQLTSFADTVRDDITLLAIEGSKQ